MTQLVSQSNDQRIQMHSQNNSIGPLKNLDIH